MPYNRQAAQRVRGSIQGAEKMAVGDIGILWRIDLSKTIDVNIKDGLAAHLKRTGKPAEIVDMHPDDFKNHFVDFRGVEIREEKACLLHELFIGVCAKNAQAEVSHVKQ
jgi:hypothetical protein